MSTEYSWNSFRAKVGQLPAMASGLIGMMDLDGVIGADLWKTYKTTFLPGEAKLVLEKLEDGSA